MLKLKLLIGLLMIAALLVAMSLFSISLLRDHVAKIDRILDRDFDAMEAVNELQNFSGDLNASYVSVLGGDEEDYQLPPADRAIEFRKNYEKRIEKLRSKMDPDDKELATAMSRFEDRWKDYFDTFDSIHQSPQLDLQQRFERQAEIMEASYNLSQSAQQLLGFYRTNLESESLGAVTTAKQSIRFLVVSMLIALVLMAFLYIQLWRTVIRPMEELTESIREVQRRNFERTVPVKTRDEVGRVAQAFNDMSAELRLLKSETDRELLKLNQENRAILAGFPHPTFILDNEGALSQANPAAEEMMTNLRTGGRLPLKVGLRFDETRKTGEDHLPEDLSEAMLFRVKEREFWYLPRIFEIGDPENPKSFSGWAVVLIDVSRFRWLDDMKSNLVGTVSHEIKTPLTSIRMVLHLLAEQKTGPLNATQERMVGSAHDDCERLLETLENLLQLSRMERGASRLEREPIEPAEIVEDAIRTFEPQLSHNGSSVISDIEDKLPRVTVDPQQIGQVLNNFLSNALKHSPSDADITVAVKREGSETLRFSVIDQGEGVPAAEQDRIFERFYRAVGEKTKGSGIGLSICREIIHAHDGRIGVHSTPNTPTEFYFDLPLNP